MQAEWKLSRGLGIANLMIIHRLSGLLSADDAGSSPRACSPTAPCGSSTARNPTNSPPQPPSWALPASRPKPSPPSKRDPACGKSPVQGRWLRNAALLLIVVGQALPLVPASARTYRQYTACRHPRHPSRRLAPQTRPQHRTVAAPPRDRDLRRPARPPGMGHRGRRPEGPLPDPARGRLDAHRDRPQSRRSALPLWPRPELGNKGLAPVEELCRRVSLSDVMKHSIPLTTV